MSTIVFDTSKLARENEFDPGSPVYPENFPVDRVWNILINYVQPNSPLSQDNAIETVAQCYGSTSGSISVVYDALLCVVEQIPYHHPSHRKLADFILALLSDERLLCKRKAVRTPFSNSIPSTDTSENSRESAERGLWDSLNRSLCDNFVSPNRLYNDEEAPQDPIIYANNCAFMANLVEPEWSSRRFDYGVASFALQGATEIRAAAPEVRDAQVIGAAQFIIFQAPTIFDAVTKDRRYEAQVLKAEGRLARWGFVKRQQRHNYDLPFTSDRWQAWKHAFGAVADDKTYGKESRAIAQQAADLMALQEKIEANQLKEA